MDLVELAYVRFSNCVEHELCMMFVGSVFCSGQFVKNPVILVSVRCVHSSMAVYLYTITRSVRISSNALNYLGGVISTMSPSWRETISL